MAGGIRERGKLLRNRDRHRDQIVGEWSKIGNRFCRTLTATRWPPREALCALSAPLGAGRRCAGRCESEGGEYDRGAVRRGNKFAKETRMDLSVTAPFPRRWIGWPCDDRDLHT